MADFFGNKKYINQKKDFDVNHLPSTRRQLFKKVFISRFGKLFQVNILCFAFLLPYICWDLLTNIYKSSLTTLTSLTQFVIYIKSPLVILFTMLGFIGLSGTIYYIRRLSWSEPVYLFKTFYHGIKQSYKQFLIFGFFTSLFICLFDLAITMIQNTNLDLIYAIISISGLTISAILFLSILSYALTLSSLYEMRISTIIKTSVVLTLRKMFKNLVFELLTYVLILIWFLSGIIYFYFIGIVIIAIIGISYSILVWVLFTNSSYDLYINLKQYPNIYRKGLKPLTKEGVIDA